MNREDNATRWQDEVSPTGRRRYGVPPYMSTPEMRAWCERDAQRTLEDHKPDGTSLGVDWSEA